MKVFSREIELMEIPAKVLMMLIMSARAVCLFKHPLRLIYFYILSKPLPEKVIELRNGSRLYLSSYPQDLITVVVVFCKREYGEMPKDGNVIDIGANIGAFSLYAMFNGAGKVFSFEPNKEAFEILTKNIKENGLGDSIIPNNLAVSGKDNETVRISIYSNPNNVVNNDNNVDDKTVEVKTISLQTIIESNNLDDVGLIKMDCEGAEYEIVEAAKDDTYGKIKNIRFEYHNGTERLTKHLDNYGFKMESFYPDNKRVGRVFYAR